MNGVVDQSPLVKRIQMFGKGEDKGEFDQLGGLKRAPANADPRACVHTAAAFYSFTE